MRLNVLEVSPYEPPASGWVRRIKLLRQVIEARGGRCEILDIGPNRRVQRPGCIPVLGSLDYLLKVAHFARRGFTIHGHINAEYFRGLLLCQAAAALARLFGTRFVVTFHAGTVQPFFGDWRKQGLAPLYRAIFRLSHAAICNSHEVKQLLRAYVRPEKLHVVPAFSVQYLSYRRVTLDPAIERFLAERSPILSTYLCFREGFFTDTAVAALARLKSAWPNAGLVIVGTGPDRPAFEQRLAAAGLERHALVAGDLGHDAFMTLLGRTTVHLRTPVTDGVSATVLEALSLRVPVVASDNGTRPEGVVTYPAADAPGMAAALDRAIRHREELVARLPFVPVADTAALEVNLLLGTAAVASAPAA